MTGAPLFFMFHMGTKAHYFDSTLKYGGAKYRPTGRGFVMHHEEFAANNLALPVAAAPPPRAPHPQQHSTLLPSAPSTPQR